LREFLGGRFPDFPEAPDHPDDRGRVELTSPETQDPSRLVVEWQGDITRVQIGNLGERGEVAVAMRDDRPPPIDHDAMCAVLDAAPYPVWRQDDDGSVSWYNSAFGALFELTGKDNPQEVFGVTDAAPDADRLRIALDVANSDGPLWFQVTRVLHDGHHLYYATDIDAVIRAEDAQRNFVQTLAKTFAQLSTGLAIFDRNRQLVLFNPALIDLTGLSAEFLSNRPTLFSFFDSLRDNRMMPEPKNYGSWRHQLSDLVAAATNGHYQETWSLASGSVYTVSGRPHPDGAVAFLFEDITAEVTLTRRFRSDLEMGQSILDQIDDAICVFAQNGTMTFSNRSCRSMWCIDPDIGFAETTVIDATKVWQEGCAPTPAWGDLRDYVGNQEDRAEWFAEIIRKTGERQVFSVYPVNGGSTMVRFSKAIPDRLAAEGQGVVPETA